MPRFSPDELMGKSLVCVLDDQTNYKAVVLETIQDYKAENHSNIKALVELGIVVFNEAIGCITLRICIEELEDINNDCKFSL